MTTPIRMEVYVAIDDGNERYYLLKVQRRDFDVYCFPPRLGVHYSLHESGKAHFRGEKMSSKRRKELPVAMSDGEAGIPYGDGFVRRNLVELGKAICVYGSVYLIQSLAQDYEKFNRSPAECFVIDTRLLPTDTSAILVEVWAVPERNKASFEWNRPEIPDDMLYKVTQYEPQIWIYAEPFT